MDTFMYLLGFWPWAVALGIVLIIVANTVKVVQAYERAVVFRLGKFSRVADPGLMILLPFIERIYSRPDMRTKAMDLAAQGVLSKDMVELDVSAICVYRTVDAKNAALNISGSASKALSLVATAALREIIGASTLEDSLGNRAVIGSEILGQVKDRATNWGLDVESIEIKDVTVPEALANALSQSAQADREQKARVLLASAEMQIAQTFVDAAKVYEQDPTALELRRMNILYEGLKTDNKGFIVIPSSVASALSMNGAVKQAVTS